MPSNIKKTIFLMHVKPYDEEFNNNVARGPEIADRIYLLFTVNEKGYEYEVVEF